MPRLPVMSGHDVIRALARLGFVVERQHGSHVVMRRDVPGLPVVTVSVPVHGSRDMKSGTLRAILRQAGVSVEELLGAR